MKIRRSVVPGDQLVLVVRSVRTKDRMEYVQGRAMVDDQIAAEAEIRFMLIDSDKAA